MSVSVSGGSSPDLLNLMMMKKAMEANKTQTSQLLEGVQQATPAPAPAAAPAQRTWYL